MAEGFFPRGLTASGLGSYSDSSSSESSSSESPDSVSSSSESTSMISSSSCSSSWSGILLGKVSSSSSSSEESRNLLLAPPPPPGFFLAVTTGLSSSATANSSATFLTGTEAGFLLRIGVSSSSSLSSSSGSLSGTRMSLGVLHRASEVRGFLSESCCSALATSSEVFGGERYVLVRSLAANLRFSSVFLALILAPCVFCTGGVDSRKSGEESHPGELIMNRLDSDVSLRNNASSFGFVDEA